MLKFKSILQLLIVILPLFCIILFLFYLFRQNLFGFLIPLVAFLGFYLSLVYIIIFGKKGEWRVEVASYLRKKLLNDFKALIICNFILLVIIVFSLFLIFKKSELDLRGDVVINHRPIKGIAEVVVVGIDNKFYTNEIGFFNFYVRNENQKQITLRGSFSNWIGSKIVNKENFLSIELPLTAKLINDSPNLNYFSKIPTILIGNIESNEISFIEQLTNNKLFNKPISDIIEESKKMPELLVSDSELLEEQIIPLNIDFGNQAMVIAISRYLNHNLPPLISPINDVRKIKKLISEKIWNFKNVSLLLDEQATRNNVKKMLHENIHSSDNDCLFFYFNGHWYIDQKLNITYLLLYDSDLEHVYSTSISLNQLFEELQSSSSKRIIIILEGMKDYLLPDLTENIN